MHELSLTKSILRHTLIYAEEMEAEKVIAVILQLGVLRDLKEEWLQRYFSYISKGTLAEGAQVIILPMPVVAKCRQCETEFSLEVEKVFGQAILCPTCQVQDYDLISGTQFMIQAIKIV